MAKNPAASDKFDPEDVAAGTVRGARAVWILAALVLGLLLGAMAARFGDGLREPALRAATVVGGLWLDALKMTVIPLIFALLVTGIAKGAQAARAGRIAGRAVLWFVLLCTASAIFGALAIGALLDLFPLPQSAAEALRAGLVAIDPAAAASPVPQVADFFRSIVPSNVISAAAEGQILQLVMFAFVFALALTRIGAAHRTSVVAVFEGIGDALLVVIGWVLWIAPLGVFALAFAVGAGSGGAAFAALLHYVVLVSAVGVLVTLAAYVVAVGGGRIGLARFARAMIGPQAVAISTQSSLASLPAMLAAARLIGTRDEVADVSLPLAVALFRATGPAMNVAVAIYVAHWMGIEIGMTAMIAGVAVAAVASYGAVSLPGQISFFSSIAPIAVAMGVPVAPLAILIAVETIPDIFRTLGNVTMDVAVTGAVDRERRPAD
ncbi:MAG TPA: cation:dicarboxylase symporter family transporter [Sphingomicrobium sp.]|nr:cation:dicarboxylase symporter family transporter [Sphingomicrobium sp.]